MAAAFLFRSMTQALFDCPAPAKLNLFLHVVGRRDDGYHLLQTVFQLVDRSDKLDFALRTDGQVRRTADVPGVPEDSDLVVRAARLLQSKTGTGLGADITLHKHLPMGGGVGGGSSDAATTLIALNRLWHTGLTRKQLMALGLQLGADVPFFIYGSNAFAEGVGEELQAVETPDAWYVVIEPGVHIPTPEIFRSKALTRDTELSTIADFSRSPKGYGKNDLQAVAVSMFPQVGKALEALGQFGSARMTGSGSCVFCAFEREGEADAALAQLTAWRSWKARGLSRHPLESWVQE